MVITGWESPEVLRATLTDVLRRGAARIAADRLTVGGPEDEVTVVIGADGFLVSVDIAETLRDECPPAEVAGIVAAAVRRAERAAAARRRVLADTADLS